jgi:hypothetical protein
MLGVALDFSQGYNIFKHESKDQSWNLTTPIRIKYPLAAQALCALHHMAERDPLTGETKKKRKEKPICHG